jgi:leucyl/phenylalanyl-tRNA--protein transferase
MLEQGPPVLYWENIEGGHGGAADNAQRARMRRWSTASCGSNWAGAERRAAARRHADLDRRHTSRCRRPAGALGPTATRPGLVAAGGRVTRRGWRGLPPGHLPLVQRGPAGAVVEPRPAHGAAGGRVPLRTRCARRCAASCARRAANCASTAPSARDPGLRPTPREGQDGTWIVPAMVGLYRLAPRRPVHSVETWVDGELVGGLYGVAIGRMFFGESMFAHAPTPRRSRWPRWWRCAARGVPLIDCQQNTRHLASAGRAREPRAAFLAHLAARAGRPHTHRRLDL